MHSLLKKLNFKEGQFIDICSTPPEFSPVFALWEQNNAIRVLPHGEHKLFVLIFVYGREDIKRMVESYLENLDSKAVLWFAYPNQSSHKYKSDVSRDNGWEVLGEMNYRAVRQIVIDDDWSAIRFRHNNKVKFA